MLIHDYMPRYDYCVCYTVDDENWMCAETDSFSEFDEFVKKLVIENDGNEDFSYFCCRTQILPRFRFEEA